MSGRDISSLLQGHGHALEFFLLGAAVFFFLYPILFYPLIISLLARLFPRPIRKSLEEMLPSVTIITPAYNEEKVISEKIHNTLSLDYPSGRLELIIASDGSDDRTAERVRAIPDPRIHLLDFPERRGKLAILKEVVGKAAGEIVVFSDASAILATDALKKLVANFADPTVGCVSGRYVIRHDVTPLLDGRSVGERGYFEFEVFQRIKESLFYSTLGAHGAFYGIRRDLFPDIPTNVVNDDFVIPMEIVKKGYRTVYEDQALVFEIHQATVSGEFKRRIRISHGNFQQIALLRSLLGLRYPRVALVFWSHKVIRIFQPFYLIGILLLPLAIGGPLYRSFFFLQVLFYSIGGVAIAFRLSSKLFAIPLYFVLGNAAILGGLIRYLKRRTSPLLQWEQS
jgi:cellulose synthase/poly-beta-1,6-N-acetylglucosamine synthase-like glycosyltransferase